MIWFLIWLSITSIGAFDKCQEYRTQKDCISSKETQCIWDSGYCEFTKNLELGCLSFLNKMACLKQLSYPSGEMAKCIFKTKCQPIQDLSNIICNDQISKHACLGITNSQQLCYWDPKKYSCIQIIESTYQQDFSDVLYSASVCSRITDFLIIHSSLLWQITGYVPDFSAEAQNIYRQDLGLEYISNNKVYETGGLANNYIYKLCDESNQATYFKWYNINDAQSYTTKYLKISDRQREGCIAIEIKDNDDYNQIFENKIDTIGVNSIYCRYQGGIFTNYRCIYYDDELILKNENYLTENQVQCNQLSLYQCSYVQMLCFPVKRVNFNEQQITCASSMVELIRLQGCQSSIKEYQTFKDCAIINDPGQGSYLDLYQSPPACSSACFTKIQSNCDLDQCKYIQNQDSNDFYNCLPKYGCEQPGVNKYYCMYMALPCQWDTVKQSCFLVQDYQLNIVYCNDALSKFLCGSIKTMGEECIWIDEDEVCLNVLSVPSLKQFRSFPQKYIVNRILCMNYSGYHNYNKFKCLNYQTDGTCLTENPNQFNKELCLNTKGCFWDIMNQQCQPAQIKSTCSEMQSVSPDACSSFTNCIYDSSTNNCVVQSSNISCDSPGLSQQKCLSLTDQPCQWMKGQCRQVTQFREVCTSYRNVTKLVCSMQQTQKCFFNNNTCQLVDTQPTDCQDTFNKFACQYSKASCYFFDNKCLTFSDTNTQINCEGYYLSQTACLKLKTPGQECIWDSSQCIYINKNINCLVPGSFQINQWACVGIKAEISGYLDKQFYCKYDSDQCLSSQAAITGCGETDKINRQRCSGHTDGKCVFDNYQCKSIDDTHIYWYTKLGQINCEQANKNTCLKVRGRLCQWIDQPWAGDNDKRCGQVTIYSIDCNKAGIDDNSRSIYDYFKIETYNPQVCANMYRDGFVERCIRNAANDKCEIPSAANYYTCDQLGINKRVCLFATYGQCGFKNGLCQDVSQNHDFECENLNSWACINSHKQCFLISGYTLSDDLSTVTLADQICSSSIIPTSSTCTNINFSQNQTSWSVCATVNGCYGLLGTCVALPNGTTPKTKCDSPGVSSTVCLDSAMLCQFRDGKCKNISQNKCEFENTLTDCVSNLYYNCIYQDGKCYTQNLSTSCDQYDYTNFLFCRQYSHCKYDHQLNKCIDLSLFHDIQNNLIQYDSIDCTQYLNQFDCLVQWKTICKFTTSCENTSAAPASCPHLQQYSKMMCQQFQNCSFKFSYFCVDETQVIQCSDLNSNQCLQDIDNSLTCYWDGTNCQSITNQTCANVQTYQLNYAGCQKVSNQDGQKCFYQQSSQKCKVLQETNTCASYTTNIECALRANASCLLGNPASATTTCTSSSSFNANLNQYGCTQLTGSAYYYDVYTYTCKLMDWKKVQGCQNLNRDACTKSTSDALVIKCGWINNQCQQLRDLTNITDCTILNQYACINIEITTLTCQWNVAAKTCTSSAQTACYVPASIPSPPATLYSLSLCSKAGNTNACQANYNNSGCITFNYQIEICSGLGLNKKACIELTTGYCKWQDNQCQNSQLDNLNCNSDVNQNTCLQINNQLCQWNNTTKVCSDKILTLCSDATNYNQCMNVPNKQCEFVDTCHEVTTTPIICKNGYNLTSCKNVQGQICQFKDGICSMFTYFDFWQVCAKYSTSATCPTNNCEWSNSKCIKKTECNLVSTSSTIINDLPYQLQYCSSLYPAACIQIFNKQACMQYKMLCQWDDITGCSSFYTYLTTIVCDGLLKVNQKVCDSYAPTFCEFKIDTCSPQISDYYFTIYPTQTLALSEINHDIDILTCDQYLTEQDCIWSTIYPCYWNGSCVSTSGVTVTDFSALNIIGCRENNLQWRQRKCMNQNFQFQPNEYLDKVENCETKFISKQTCLGITTEACTFDATLNQCLKTLSFSDLCSIYVLVNKKTCQLLTNYACGYNPATYSCTQINDSITDLSSFSRRACLGLNSPVFWNNECLKATNFECDSGFQSSQQACQQVQTPCIYDENSGTCTSIYNINSLTCDSLGVSASTCTQILREPCIFQNNKCQKIPSNYTCNQAKQVNEIACASLEQACSYDSINQLCSPVTQILKCSTAGLSKQGCQMNNACQFNIDFLKCECSLSAKTFYCQSFTKKQCDLNQSCLYDTNQKQCRRKLCEDQQIAQCVGELQGKQCYVNGTKCQSASKCEDIINVNSNICQKIFFDGIPCVGTGLRCFTWNNYLEFCPYSNCSSAFCKFNSQNVCVPKECSDLESCTDFGNKCVKLNDGTCIENSSCQLLDSEYCNGVTVNTQSSCLLQKYNIYLDDLICTSQVCELYGISDLCNGNQYNEFTCLLQDQKCQPCEQISDGCSCAEALGICLWNGNTCTSFQCKELLNSESCNQISRCLWSESQSSCLLHCNKIISEDDCNSRTDECYYDSAINFCKAGKYQSPNLSIKIDIVSSEGYILLLIQIGIVLVWF